MHRWGVLLFMAVKVDFCPFCFAQWEHVSTVFGRWIPIPQIHFLEFAGIGRLIFGSGQSFCRGRCRIIAFLFGNIRPDPLLRADLPALGRMCFQLEVWTASLSRHPCSIGNQHQRDVKFTFPAMMLTFRTVFVVGLFANLLALWPTTLLLQFGLGAAVLQLLLPGTLAAFPLELPAGWLAKYLCTVVSLLAQIPYANILRLPMGLVLLWVAAYSFCWHFGYSWDILKILCRIVGWFILVFFSWPEYFPHQILRRNLTRIAITDVGSGLSVAPLRGMGMQL